MLKSRRAGFTLIELVVVIIVISLLILMALPQYTKMIERGKKAVAIAKMDAIKKAEGMYYASSDRYSQDRDTELFSEVPEVKSDPEGWAFTLTNSSTGFTIQANRTSGKWSGNTMTYDSTSGNLTYNPTDYGF